MNARSTEQEGPMASECEARKELERLLDASKKLRAAQVAYMNERRLHGKGGPWYHAEQLDRLGAVVAEMARALDVVIAQAEAALTPPAATPHVASIEVRRNAGALDATTPQESEQDR